MAGPHLRPLHRDSYNPRTSPHRILRCGGNHPDHHHRRRVSSLQIDEKGSQENQVLAPPAKSLREITYHVLTRNSPGISPDPESERSICNLPDPHAESCRYLPPRKTADSSILRADREESLVSASAGLTTLRKLSKNPDLRGVKLDSGRGINE